jgi:hypothetical protein
MLGKAALGTVFLTACVLLASAAVAAPVAESNALDQAIERVLTREAANYKTLQQLTPLVETYIQELRADEAMGPVPIGDHYFLGRASFKGYVRNDSFLGNAGHGHFAPLGFAQMAVIDPTGFDRQHYDFKFLTREFLSEVRCLVFDVTPKAKTGKGRFLGRIWVEDQEYNIVRVNGVFAVAGARTHYVHFDTWRLNLQPGLWLPAYVYSEEENILVGLRKTATFRSQTRFWGYVSGEDGSGEFTQVLVDPSSEVKDKSERPRFLSPLAAERAWHQQAEDNVLGRLRRAGLLGPPGNLEQMLQTVVNNLIITNNLTFASEVRCRVLLTTPIESFTVGNTIVVSRGLLDVIPDEAALAAILAHELSHIVLDHRLSAKYAYSDRVIFSDDQTLRRLTMMRTPAEEQAADRKSVELLKNSPYRDKLMGFSLFMQQLEQSRNQLPNLIRARLGNALLLDKDSPRSAGLAASASKLDPAKIDQIAALPLGGRINLDPWAGAVEMSKAQPVALLKAREKLVFELTPVFPNVTRMQFSSVVPRQADMLNGPQ